MIKFKKRIVESLVRYEKKTKDMKLLYVQNQSRQAQAVQSSMRGYHSISGPSQPNPPLNKLKLKKGRRENQREPTGLGGDSKGLASPKTGFWCRSR